MSQLTATFMKTMKFFIRNRALLLGIVAWPLVLTALMAYTELAGVPVSEKPLALGALTVSMVGFALMLACIMNLPASIARDREIGLLVKLRSMPINAGVDTMGRLLAYLVLAVVVTALVTLLGLGLGARFEGGVLTYIETIGFLLVAVIAAAGIGLVLGALVKSVQGTAFFGLALSLIFAFVSGIFVPYDQLSAQLQAFSRSFPISSATSSAGYLLLGQDAVGYDPLTLGQIVTGIVVAFTFLAVGLLLYHRTSWHQEPTSAGPFSRRYRIRHETKLNAHAP